MKRVYKSGIIAVVISLAVLSGCESEEEIAVKRAKKGLEIVYTYDYDTTRVVVEKEKSIEELAKEMMLENVGLNTGIKKFARSGVEKGQGIFIESAIRDGSVIPKVSAMSKEDIELLNTRDDEFEAEKKKAFITLKKNRGKVLAEQYADDSVEEEKLRDELEKKVEEQKKRIEKQKDLVDQDKGSK